MWLFDFFFDFFLDFNAIFFLFSIIAIFLSLIFPYFWNKLFIMLICYVSSQPENFEMRIEVLAVTIWVFPSTHLILMYGSLCFTTVTLSVRKVTIASAATPCQYFLWSSCRNIFMRFSCLQGYIYKKKKNVKQSPPVSYLTQRRKHRKSFSQFKCVNIDETLI